MQDSAGDRAAPSGQRRGPDFRAAPEGMPNATIAGLGVSVPDQVLTNFDLERMVGTSDEWIRTRTGIRERRVAGEGVSTSDLAAAASREALTDAGVSPEELDLIVLATFSPDCPYPATACAVQAKIGARNAAAFDISAMCSGFVYGLSVAQQFVRTGAAANVLLIGAEVLSSVLDYRDRNTCILFGDAAGAAVQGQEWTAPSPPLWALSSGTNPTAREFGTTFLRGKALPPQFNFSWPRKTSGYMKPC